MVALDTLGAELRPLEAKHMEQTKQLEQVTLQVSQAMENYNGLVSNNETCQGGSGVKDNDLVVYIDQHIIRDIYCMGRHFEYHGSTCISY